MTWMLLLAWVGPWTGASVLSPIAAPTTLGPFSSLAACQHAQGQVVAMASDMRAGIPGRDARRLELVHWRCIEVRP